VVARDDLPHLAAAPDDQRTVLPEPGEARSDHLNIPAPRIPGEPAQRGQLEHRVRHELH
jgi:hypothetical protein